MIDKIYIITSPSEKGYTKLLRAFISEDDAMMYLYKEFIKGDGWIIYKEKRTFSNPKLKTWFRIISVPLNIPENVDIEKMFSEWTENKIGGKIDVMTG